MTDSLAAHLNQHGVDPARLEHAMRFLVARWADYQSLEDMTAELVDHGITDTALQTANATLTASPDLLAEAVLDIMSAAWNNPDDQEAARGSIQESSNRLPVIEVGAIVVSAMYGLWLLTTRGRRSTTRTIRRHADGTYEETETVDWYDPAGPLHTVVDLLRPAAGGHTSPAAASDTALPGTGPNGAVTE